MLLKSNSTKLDNYNYYIAVWFCVVKQLIKLYLNVNIMLKGSQLGLSGLEFFTTLLKVREIEVNYRCEDKTAWPWLT